MSVPFLPKQAVKFDGALAQELQGDVSEYIARQVLQEVPPIKPGFIIHDNGCGYGSVTGEIMAAGVPSDVHIHATDKNESWLSQLRATIAKNPNWPVTPEIMDSINLSFPDNHFDLSITDFVIRGLDDEVGAARQVLRTVKPGGTAAITVWKEKPWQSALQEAHRRTRGDETPMAPFIAMADYDKADLEDLLVEAGFKNIRFVEKEAWIQMPDMRRWSTIAWTFLATPVGGWKQSDEDTWDQAIDVCVEEMQKGDWHVVENGVHKIRMIAIVAITEKQ